MLMLFNNKKDSFFALSFSAIFCFFNVLACYFATHLTIECFFDFFVLLLNFIFFLPIIAEFYLRFRNFLKKHLLYNTKLNPVFCFKQDIKYYSQIVLILFLAYLPVYLAFYPGIFTYDIFNQIPQWRNGYNNDHPLIHTLILHFFYFKVGELLDDYSYGVAFYSFFQLVIACLTLGAIHLFLYRVNVRAKIRWFLIAITALAPQFPICFITSTKDVLFACFFSLFCLVLSYWKLAPDRYVFKLNNIWQFIFYALVLCGVICFRLNAIYAIGIFILFLLWRIYNGYKLKFFFVLTLSITLLSAFGLKSLSSYLNAKNGNSTHCYLFLPYQQIAHVYKVKNAELSQTEKYLIKYLMPRVENYVPYFADEVAYDAKDEGHEKKFIDLYFKLLIKYPHEFLFAFIQQYMGYFYIFNTTSSKISSWLQGGYLYTNITSGYGVEARSFFPTIKDFYTNLISINHTRSHEYQNIAILAFLTSQGFYIWLSLLFIFYNLHNARKVSLAGIVVLSYLFTMLLGPCAVLRYALPIIMSSFVLLVMAVKTEDR